MKNYQRHLKIYRSKCQFLEEEKKSLKNDKCHLEWEVSRLKEQLDTISISSGLSGQSQSCPSLSEINVSIYCTWLVVTLRGLTHSELKCTKSSFNSLPEWWSCFVCSVMFLCILWPKNVIRNFICTNVINKDIYCILHGQIKGCNSSITVIMCQVGSYRTVIG